ncbi:TadE/TadG family type IV pilus assembly protein [Gimesia aquarii]|uniref:Uncharacterized protein n=1 Tax=Gimesia aquarii TaxID=2527964 RepID=A0A517W0Q3_9PLAN|nr:hypothetical protein [Gimesia aquarii]QDT98826.1 hypothetical protein V144x_43350 [Gimesia aquarii]
MKRIQSKTELHHNRRGIAILWLVIWGSLFLTFFCVLLEIATLWQAQVELNNALDSATLAAVREWDTSGLGSTEIPRNVGVAYAAANPILGTPVGLNPNFQPVNPNGNDSFNGDLVFGGLTALTRPNSLDPAALAPATFPAVRAQITVPVQGFCSTLFGFSFLNVSASSIAYVNTVNGQPALVSVGP